ncbi:phytanoyl-CoA dioxygenase family protein [Phenylobacterium sp.]|uniref:phytanoyl-CoA dioxygenase family protein n=1 Tax=Phenylobacterium sp. TaxID=1871053 RepID=UPI0028127E39|nr:phytanoyl-CoA dioxygenase family protein [Phenylobacterium sp.]
MTFMPGFISPERATELRELLSRFECQDPWKPERGLFRLEHAPEGTHVADIPETPTIKALHDIAFDERLLNLAARYFGCRPYVDSIQTWWSVSGNSEPEEAENFHRDNDSIRFLKFFLYLTDVGEENGPHRFVKGSHVEAKALARRRLTDAEVEEAFGADRILSMTGRAGDGFMEDTFGVHKGQLPRAGTRLLYQVRYSTMPTVFRSRILVRGPQPPLAAGADSLLHARR